MGRREGFSGCRGWPSLGRGSPATTVGLVVDRGCEATQCESVGVCRSGRLQGNTIF